VKCKYSLYHSKEKYEILGINGELIKNLKEMIEVLSIVMESLLLDITNAKKAYRNLFVFLNESVIRSSKQTTNSSNAEIENTKNHLAKLTSNKEILLKLLSSAETLFMDNISSCFDTKYDEQLKRKASVCHLVQDIATGIIYRKERSANELTGSWKKEQLPLPRSTQFVTEYKPISGIKTIIGNVKHLFDCIYWNPMKVFSNYFLLNKSLSFIGASSKAKICDTVSIYSGNVHYCLLIHLPLPSNFME